MQNRVIVIAEAGVNHNGNLELAMKLIDTAAMSGADYVKFQTFKADKIVSKAAKKATYLSNKIIGDDLKFAMLKKLEMPAEWHFKLFKYAKEKGTTFLSTGFDNESIDFLSNLGLDLFKIPSGEITKRPPGPEVNIVPLEWIAMPSKSVPSLYFFESSSPSKNMD